MSNILKALYSHLLDFISDIIVVFPENRSLKVTKTALETWRRVNPKSIIETWKTCITDKYKIEIAKGDYNFFMKKVIKKTQTLGVSIVLFFIFLLGLFAETVRTLPAGAFS